MAFDIKTLEVDYTEEEIRAHSLKRAAEIEEIVKKSLPPGLIQKISETAPTFYHDLGRQRSTAYEDGSRHGTFAGLGASRTVLRLALEAIDNDDVISARKLISDHLEDITPSKN